MKDITSQAPLITTLVESEYALDANVISRLGHRPDDALEVLEMLESKLQSEEMADTVFLSDTILDVVRESTSFIIHRAN